VAEVAWTEEALAWLRDIHDYIAEENPAAAMRVAEGIYERVDQLRVHPESGYRYEQSSRHVRILLYGHYRIAYEVDSERDVTILGVFHAALDIARYAL
jgi:plasmid stabilization system protein ParE